MDISERINNGMQYRAMTLECRKAEDKEECSYIVEGYATTFNEPYNMGEDDDIRVLEQVSNRAFDNCDMSDVIAQYDHCGHVYARTGNKTLELSLDEHGLKVRMYLGGTTEGKKLYEEISGEYTTKMSFGFIISDETRTQRTAEDGKRETLYTINAISKLFDVSAVSLPANDGTTISARNRFSAEVEKRSQEAEADLQAEQERKAEEEKNVEHEKAQKERERLALELSFSL